MILNATVQSFKEYYENHKGAVIASGVGCFAAFSLTSYLFYAYFTEKSVQNSPEKSSVVPSNPSPVPSGIAVIPPSSDIIPLPEQSDQKKIELAQTVLAGNHLKPIEENRCKGEYAKFSRSDSRVSARSGANSILIF